MAHLRQAVLVSVASMLLAAVAIGALPTVGAQVLDPAASVAITNSTAPLGPGNSTVLDGTVSNDNGQAAGTVTLAFTAPAGWTVVLDPASAFQLAAGSSAPFTVTITAPADAPPTDGDLSVTATITDQAGRSSTSAPATVALTFVPLPPPPVIPWYQTPGGIAGIVAAILLVTGAIAYILWRRRQTRLAAERAAAETAAATAKAAYLARETGITIALAGDPIQYGHKREVVYRINVKNVSDRPRVGVVEVAQTTNGWRAALQFNRVPLHPGQSQHVTLVVTPDSVITPGDRATILLKAKPEEAQELAETLHIDVTAAKHGVPADPHYRIVSVHREGANVGVNR